MKIRVIKPFMDKAFNNEITREIGDIIDTEDESFKCDEKLAKERIKGGFAEEVKGKDKDVKSEKTFSKDEKATEEDKGKKEIDE